MGNAVAGKDHKRPLGAEAARQQRGREPARLGAGLRISDPRPIAACRALGEKGLVRPELRPAVEPAGDLGVIRPERNGRAGIEHAVAAGRERDIERAEIDRALIWEGLSRHGRFYGELRSGYLSTLSRSGRGCDPQNLALWSRRRRPCGTPCARANLPERDSALTL